MNVDPLLLTLSYIDNLVTNISKKNIVASAQEIKELLQCFGIDAEEQLYKSVINQLHWPVSETKSAASARTFGNGVAGLCIITTETEEEKSASQLPLSFCGTNSAAIVLLLQQLASFTPLDRFTVCLSEAISSANKLIRPNWVSSVCKIFKLSKVQEVVVLLQLLKSPNSEIQSQAAVLLKNKLPELIQNYIEAERVGQELSDLCTETLHLISTWCGKEQSLSKLLSKEQISALVVAIQKEFPRQQSPLVVLPVAYTKSDILKEKLMIELVTMGSKSMNDASLADVMSEVGYSFCGSLDECKSNLIGYGIAQITPAVVAKALGFMMKTYTGLLMEQMNVQNLSDPSSLWNDKDKSVAQRSSRSSFSEATAHSPVGNLPGQMSQVSWNVEIFIKAIQELVPNFNGMETVTKLDHKGFYVKERAYLKFFLTTIKCLIPSLLSRTELFPVEFILRPWKHTEEQLVLISQILNNSDLFCFTDYPCPTTVIENLKAVPEMENKEVQNWKCLQLVETLLSLGDAGHYAAVKEIFKFPCQQCPDILMLGLIQASSPFTALRQDLIKKLVPSFMGSHPNSTPVLHSLWNSTKYTSSLQQAFVDSISEWYMVMENDPGRLSRILDVAHDMKSLLHLLNSKLLPFVIDLACLAYRREFLNLNKWLPEQINDIGEPLVAACIKFLHIRCPPLVGGKDDALPKSSQLSGDVILSIVNTLQQVQGKYPEHQESITTIVQNWNTWARTRAIKSIIGAYPSQNDGMSNLTSGLGNLSIGNATATSLYPSTPGINISTMGAIGSNIPPSSPARVSQPPSSQGSLGSIMSQTSYSVPSNLVSQLASTNQLSDTLRSQSGQPQLSFSQQRSSMQIAEILDIPALIPKDIDDEANGYFQRIYNMPPCPTLTITEVLDMLKKFHNSSVKREKEVYMCMLKNLFEEYKFFPTYPLRELILTARLFGGLIEQGFVEFMALGIALRLVMEALQKAHGSKMYYFGVVALDKFKSRMKDYPRYCKHLLSIKHFNEFPPHLISYIKHGAESKEPPNRPTGEVLPASLAMQINAAGGASWNGGTELMSSQSTGSLKSYTTTTTTTSNVISKSQSSVQISSGGKNSMGTASIETLIDATEEDRQYPPPPEAVQEKVAFIFNNLSQINLPQKSKELKDELVDNHWDWFAQYLVMKRVSIEPNFHPLYSSFLDSIGMPILLKFVTVETLRNLKVLLRMDKSLITSHEKILLKNLGHWLGLVTLGKNKPILQIDIDMKSLLIEAYRNGAKDLQHTVPFFVKVMEATGKSSVFRPPNPWTMAMMGILAELHAQQDTKLHIKFEIEVLCNKLEISLKDVKPTHILRNPERLARIQPQLTEENRRAESTPLMPPYQTGGPYTDWPVTQDRRTGAAKQVNKDIYQSARAEATVNAQSSSAGATPTPPSIPVQAGTPTISSMQQIVSEPKFSYKDVHLNLSRFFESNITLNHQLYNLDNSTHLKQIIRHAVELAVQEISSIVIERSIKVAVTTTERLIKKDFPPEVDEPMKMRACAHNLVRSLASAQTMIPCKDHMAPTIAKGLKQSLMSHFNRTSPHHIDHLDNFVNSVAQDNVPMACAYVQKTAAEKAVQELDAILSKYLHECENRKSTRSNGQTMQDERIPERLRTRSGGPSQSELLVYQEFGKNIPGFIQRSENEVQEIMQDTCFIPKPVPIATSYGMEETNIFVVLTERFVNEMDAAMQSFGALSSPLLTLAHGILDGVHLARTNRDSSTDSMLIKKSVENLLEAAREFQDAEPNPIFLRFRDLHLYLLKTLADPRLYGNLNTMKMVARSWLESREDVRYNIEAINWFLRYKMIHIPAIDDHLLRILEDLHPMLPISTQLVFLIKFVQNYLIEDTSVLNENDLPMTISKLVTLCSTRQVPDVLLTLVESMRYRHEVMMGERGQSVTEQPLAFCGTRSSGISSPTAQHFYSGVNQATDTNDPSGLKEKTELLLRHWIKMYHSGTNDHLSTQAFQVIVKEMDMQGILKTDDVITRFFRQSITLCRDFCMHAIMEGGSANSSPTYVRTKCFPHLDAFVRLIALLVKQSGEPGNPGAKINLLNKFLGLITGMLMEDIKALGVEFNQLPYHRMLIMLFLELNAPETILESINVSVLVAFTQTLHFLKPTKCPGFVYAWLEIVSHRVFIGRMLAITPQQKGWTMYAGLFTDLFQFLAPFLRNVELSKPFTMLYKGTLRVLLVLLHDFPEFLCEFHYTFCDVIPPNCIQMRNLILSAYPPKMRLPDPFMANLRVDRLPEIAVSPKINPSVNTLIQPAELRGNLDSYLKNRTPVTFLSELRSYLQVSNDRGSRYNMQLMNALVLYVGIQAISHIQAKGASPTITTIAHSAHMDIFENLAVDLDTEGRYLFLVAIANQLRYPNSHTQYFSCTLLYLFTEANTEAIQEQITRVLLERLIGNRPQPWGLLITFIELLKNRNFRFWEHDFVKCAPEIEKIFDSVARSCMVKNTADT